MVPTGPEICWFVQWKFVMFLKLREDLLLVTVSNKRHVFGLSSNCGVIELNIEHALRGL